MFTPLKFVCPVCGSISSEGLHIHPPGVFYVGSSTESCYSTVYCRECYSETTLKVTVLAEVFEVSLGFNVNDILSRRGSGSIEIGLDYVSIQYGNKSRTSGSIDNVIEVLDTTELKKLVQWCKFIRASYNLPHIHEF